MILPIYGKSSRPGESKIRELAAALIGQFSLAGGDFNKNNWIQ